MSCSKNTARLPSTIEFMLDLTCYQCRDDTNTNPVALLYIIHITYMLYPCIYVCVCVCVSSERGP